VRRCPVFPIAGRNVFQNLKHKLALALAGYALLASKNVATNPTTKSPTIYPMNWLDNVKWDAQGLVPVIAQEQGSNDVLMFAWMNRDALQKTAELGRAVYFSRSRNKLWFKGEESGHVQTVHEIRLDCDNDVVLLKVTQLGHEPGIACHTGRHSCFFSVLKDGAWHSVEPVLKDPETIYK
jgi:phosphoribosyl-AMP cyclohydrolase